MVFSSKWEPVNCTVKSYRLTNISCSSTLKVPGIYKFLLENIYVADILKEFWASWVFKAPKSTRGRFGMSASPNWGDERTHVTPKTNFACSRNYAKHCKVWLMHEPTTSRERDFSVTWSSSDCIWVLWSQICACERSKKYLMTLSITSIMFPQRNLVL